MTDLDDLYMFLDHAYEDYQHARTFCSATGVTYTPEAVERRRRRVVDLEADIEALLELEGEQ